MKDARFRLAMGVLGAGTFGFCSVRLGYPAQLALLTALAVVALIYSARRTYFEQRRLYRSWSDDPSAEESGISEGTEERESGLSSRDAP